MGLGARAWRRGFIQRKLLRLRRAGALIGVFDIDSDRPAAFLPGDAEALAAILRDVFGRG